MTEKIFKALADPTRLKIISFLRKGEVCACKFAPLTGKAQPTVSLHLKLLESAGIVVSRKAGKKILYRLRTRKILSLITRAEGISHG
ncbi:MAG: metalloregulator ArsR/SmtB family transcription factor [Nanoarchaeota archaeon]